MITLIITCFHYTTFRYRKERNTIDFSDEYNILDRKARKNCKDCVWQIVKIGCEDAFRTVRYVRYKDTMELFFNFVFFISQIKRKILFKYLHF